MHLVSCTNTHRDVADSVNHGLFKNTKTWIFWEWNKIKNFLICDSDDTFWEVILFCSGGNLWNKNGKGGMTTAKYEVFLGGMGLYSGKMLLGGGGNEQMFG